ncbi:hypothetical protein BGZ51_009752 [Haplosporangium sp. Z 767]|nr:hypothetical protein BGZ51_009752 [Haplosporangium sp. Z 767]
MEEDDTLQVEKSRVLEQLRLMTTEVDRLESRLQAAKRRRARAVVAALEKHQKAQDADAREMRHVLGSIREMHISDASKTTGENSSVQAGHGNQLPSKTLFSKMTSPSLAGVNIEMVRKLQSFTNIAFTSIQNHVLSSSEPGFRARRYQMTGSCFRLEFTIQFTVNEPSLDLADVKVTLPRSVQSELRRFISRVERDSMLLPFFQTLSQYAQMDYDRQALMNRLAERFPRFVKTNYTINKLLHADAILSLQTLPGGSGVQSLTFSGARKSSPELVLHWIIDVSDQGRIIPKMRLLPRMPKKWRQADDKSTLDAIPTHFVRLLQIKGSEEAVATLLQCVYGQSADESKPEASQ